MGVADNLKRAARFNSAWKPARIFKVATDEAGEALSDASGTFVFDLCESTYGRLAYDTEKRDWVEGGYQGYATVCVITGLPADPTCMIDLAGTFDQVVQVTSGDATGATVHYQATALPSGTVPNLRGQQ